MLIELLLLVLFFDTLFYATPKPAPVQILTLLNGHWGLYPWGLYAVVATALAHFTYNNKSQGFLSCLLAPFFKNNSEDAISIYCDAGTRAVLLICLASQ